MLLKSKKIQAESSKITVYCFISLVFVAVLLSGVLFFFATFGTKYLEQYSHKALVALPWYVVSYF
jgi:PST family polysaccharide transporter